jgi:hypothetical protein
VTWREIEEGSYIELKLESVEMKVSWFIFCNM